MYRKRVTQLFRESGGIYEYVKVERSEIVADTSEAIGQKPLYTGKYKIRYLLPENAEIKEAKKMMNNIGITVYACEHDEADVFRRLSPRFGVIPTIINDAVSETNARVVPGNRCISVGHKSEVSEPIIVALKDAGVRYISTRSIGCNHIDTNAAERMGITVGNVAYSPDSVADYTLMLMLMAIRGAKSIVRSMEKYDFRLDSTRGKELRDMTVGVLGTGRIGKAVTLRLQGFGCHVLAYDSGLKTIENCLDFERSLKHEHE